MVKLQVKCNDGIWTAHIDGEFFDQDPDLSKLNTKIRNEMDRRIESRKTSDKRIEEETQ